MIPTKVSMIDYEMLVQDSLRAMVRAVLDNTAAHGLPGSHYFYISLATNHPGVMLPEYLKKEYPEEITLVLQYEFWDLLVTENHFAVTLSFNDNHERVSVPFDAITNFVDPSVKFGLQFTPVFPEPPALSKKKRVAPKTSATPATRSRAKKAKGEKAPAASNVIALDAFRKKK